MDVVFLFPGYRTLFLKGDTLGRVEKPHSRVSFIPSLPNKGMLLKSRYSYQIISEIRYNYYIVFKLTDL